MHAEVIKGSRLIATFSGLIVPSVVNQCVLVSEGLCKQIVLALSALHLGLSFIALHCCTIDCEDCNVQSENLRT